MPRTKSEPLATAPPPDDNGAGSAVLTLSEAATHLRLPAVEVLRLVREQDLPARPVGTEWRFLKTAIEQWLSQPLSPRKHEGIWAFAGAWQEDPQALEMLQEIYRRRGRPLTEDG